MLIRPSHPVRHAMEEMGSVTDRARLLRIRSEIQNASGILVTVEDSGPGIDAKDLDRIFDAFLTTKSTGPGMGLSICRPIVESHDGRLGYCPGAACGATFHVAPREGASGGASRASGSNAVGCLQIGGRGPSIGSLATAPLTRAALSRAKADQCMPNRKLTPTVAIWMLLLPVVNVSPTRNGDPAGTVNVRPLSPI
jgi:hypothetical protein